MQQRNIWSYCMIFNDIHFLKQWYFHKNEGTFCEQCHQNLAPPSRVSKLCVSKISTCRLIFKQFHLKNKHTLYHVWEVGALQKRAQQYLKYKSFWFGVFLNTYCTSYTDVLENKSFYPSNKNPVLTAYRVLIFFNSINYFYFSTGYNMHKSFT